MIIELFGCPGSGKTYALEKIFTGSGYKNTNDSGIILQYFKKIVKKILLFTPYAVKLRRQILSLIDVPQYTSTFNPITIRESVNNISMLASVYKYTPRDLYVDEGIVHRIIALCINYRIPKETAKKIIEVVSSNLKNVKPYFLDTPVEICYESIISRNRRVASIDFIHGEQLLKIIDEYYQYCSYIADELGYERIHRQGLNGVSL